MSLKTSQKSKKPKSRTREPISLLSRVGLLTAVILHILIFLSFRLGSNYLPDRDHSKPYVTFVSGESLAKDVELEEYAILFDSAPLFIPTVWNASQLVEVGFENASLEPLPEFEPTIELLNELERESSINAEHFQIDDPSDLLASRFWRFFDGFGRSAEKQLSFEQASPVAEVSVIGEPQGPAETIVVELEPDASFSVPGPVSYTIRRFSDGLIWGNPTLVETSGNEAFDQSVARWLLRPDVLAQLPVGYLSIRVFFW